MFPLAMTFILFSAMIAFLYSLYQRGLLLTFASAPDNRLDKIGERIGTMLEFAIGQKRLLFRDTKSGIMHALIFWGFLIISLRTITFFGLGFNAHFELPGMDSVFGTVYAATLNVFLVLVSVACLYGIYRRLVLKPQRLTLSREGVVILCVILGLCLSDFIFEGSRFALGEKVTSGAFMAGVVGQYLTGLSAHTGYTYKAYATNAAGTSYTSTSTFTTLNTTPTNITLSASSIDENNAPNATVGTFTTTDPDAGDTFTCTSASGGADNASFTIDADALKLTPSADFETKNSYAITIRSTDQDGAFFEKDFTISITDVTLPQTITFGG